MTSETMLKRIREAHPLGYVPGTDEEARLAQALATQGRVKRVIELGCIAYYRLRSK